MSAPPDVPLIRKALPGDVTRIRAIARAAYSKYISRIGREPAPILADFAASIAADHVVVIESAGQLAGYLSGWPEIDAYFIEDIAVDPAQQSEGLGRRLMKRAISEARRLNLPALQLYTNVAMTENLSIYTHMGFVETHRTVEDGYNRVYMRLAI